MRSYGAYLTHVVQGRTLIRVRDGQWLVSMTLTPTTEDPEEPLFSTIYRAPMPITLPDDDDQDVDLYNDAFAAQDHILHSTDRVLAFNVFLHERVLVTVQVRIAYI